MAGSARGSSCALPCAVLVAWMSVARGAVDAEGFPVAGVGCVLFDNLQPEKIRTDIPPGVQLTLERRDLEEEYFELTDTLFEAPKGSLGNWKSSSLAKSIHIKGHDGVFEAKNVSLFVTRKDVDVGSKIHLCVVDRTREPKFLPPDVYSPGKSIPFMLEGGQGCRTAGPEQCARLRRYFGRLPEGVYGQSFQDRRVESDKALMPVELLKFLDTKGAVGVNMEMAALVNTGERTSLDAASVVRSFQGQFLAKGVRVFFAQKGVHWQQCQQSLLLAKNYCKIQSEWASWLEYADAAVVGESYTPGAGADWGYPEPVLDTYDTCTKGSLEVLRTNTRLREADPKRKGCEKVAGAEGRVGKKYPECKCADENAKVYCGREAAGGRKFNVDSLRSQEACSKGGMYCGVRPCLAPLARVQEEP